MVAPRSLSPMTLATSMASRTVLALAAPRATPTVCRVTIFARSITSAGISSYFQICQIVGQNLGVLFHGCTSKKYKESACLTKK